MYKFLIEPENPVTNTDEMIDEIMIWGNKEGKNISIIETKDYPVLSLEIDGKCYTTKLEPPRANPFGLPSGMPYNMGYKVILIYEK